MTPSDPTFMGQKPNLGRISPCVEFPEEGYAILKCGNTEVKIGYTILHQIRLQNSVGWNRDVSELQKALYSITCEASLGRTGDECRYCGN